jgi:carbon-monoxide dehydrogenase medium subunit
MKPASFAYHTPSTIAEAVKILGSGVDARVLSGGQSLMPMMNFRFVLPDALIDVNGIPEMSGIEVKGDRVEIGAATRQRELEFSDLIRTHIPLMTEAIPNIGHRQTRNRGTIGGSHVHADPAAELSLCSVTLGAELTAHSVRGARTIAMKDFALGYMMTALQPDEMLTKISLPIWPKGHGYGFTEFTRRRGDFAIVASAILVHLVGGRIDRVAIALGGMGQGPTRVMAAEELLKGKAPTNDLIREAASLAGETDATVDIHATVEYRRHLARMLTATTLKKAIARAEGKPHV